MNKPDLYAAIGSVAEKANRECLDEFAGKLNWVTEGAAIDLGCGDGSFTAKLRKNYIPKTYKKVIACDMSEIMLNYAKERYSDDRTTFKLWDIQKDIPQEYIGKFNNVFSFLTFHWILNQEKAFQNIYDLLINGGDCFLTIIGYLPIYEIYLILSRNAKWSTWLKNIESIGFISPYHKIKNPKNKIKEIMQKIGFKNIEVRCKEERFYFDTFDQFKVLLRSLDPTHMPEDVFDEFVVDFMKEAQNLDGFDIIKRENEPDSIDYNYCQIAVYATK